MKFVAISDTHGMHRSLNLPEGDVLIHSGDFCDFGREAHVYDFLEWFGELDFNYKVFIAGNHDLFAADQSEKFRRLIPEEVIYLEDSGTTFEGINLWGSPYQPDLVGWAFGRPRGEALLEHWQQIPKSTNILITHTPPLGILDQASSGRSLGCEILAQRLELVKPDVHVFGHIHAGYGQVRHEGTLYINASNINTQKGLVNAPVVFER